MSLKIEMNMPTLKPPIQSPCLFLIYVPFSPHAWGRVLADPSRVAIWLVHPLLLTNWLTSLVVVGNDLICKIVPDHSLDYRSEVIH